GGLLKHYNRAAARTVSDRQTQWPRIVTALRAATAPPADFITRATIRPQRAPQSTSSDPRLVTGMFFFAHDYSTRVPPRQTPQSGCACRNSWAARRVTVAFGRDR